MLASQSVDGLVRKGEAFPFQLLSSASAQRLLARERRWMRRANLFTADGALYR